MSFTYNPALSDPISRVRFRLGDTTVGRPELEDETISYHLTTLELTETGTSARLAAGIAAKYASMADVNVDDQLTKWSSVYAHWAALAKLLAAEAAAESAAPTTATAGQSQGAIIVTGIGDYRGPLDCGPVPYWLQ